MKDNVKGLINRNLPVDCLPQEALCVHYIFQKLQNVVLTTVLQEGSIPENLRHIKHA